MPIHARIAAIRSYLPSARLTNEALAEMYPEWSAERILEKTGIRERPVAERGECVSDMAVRAAEALFASGACEPDEIDYVLLCTQSPDHFLPTTACLVQDRLGLPTRCGALDFNLGCSGYVFGLGLAHGLVMSGQAHRILLLTAETYTKYIHPQDRSVRTLFGDAATATLLVAEEGTAPALGPFIYGTDGRGASNLIVPGGGLRQPAAVEAVDASGEQRTALNLYMNGPEIFTFTLGAVPELLSSLLDKAGVTMDQVDLFIFHQANRMMLEALRRKCRIPESKFHYCLEQYGNTVSSTIPLALEDALDSGRCRPGDTIALVGFGVGYSWGAALARM